MHRFLISAVLFLGYIAVSQGHELPDGQIERRVQVVVKSDSVLVEYSVAMNETTLGMQIRQNGKVPANDFSAKSNQYKTLILPLLAKRMKLQLDEDSIPLKPVRADQAGWSHPHLTCLLRGEITLAEKPKSIAVTDGNFLDVPGKYRIAMKARSGVKLEDSTVSLLVSKAKSVELKGLSTAGKNAATKAEAKVSLESAVFPREIVDFVPHSANPVFAGTGEKTWDHTIRERGCILRHRGRWHLWYTGYSGERSAKKMLGYATSSDGITWKRHPDNPVFDATWTEDVHVVHHDGKFYMVAEGRGDIPHMLTSADGVKWADLGRLDVRNHDGSPLSPGPYGTPTLWIEGETWYLFYERRDLGIWLAKSKDGKIWTNVQDDPVLDRGPSDYDRHAIALNQVIRFRDHYYAVYHANADQNRKGPWTTCIAVSDDLIRWKKYSGNPIIRTNDSSGQLIHDGQQFRLYTAHPDVKVFFPQD